MGSKQIIGIGLGVFVVFGGALFYRAFTTPDKSLLVRDVETCSGDIQCYDTIFTGALTWRAPADLLLAFREVMEQSPTIRKDCHQIMHALGRTTYTHMGNLGDLSQFDRMLAICGGGFFHGAIEQFLRGSALDERDEHVNAEELRRRAPTLCDQFVAAGKHRECAHGIGHGALFLLGVLDSALSVCEILPTEDRFSCYSGVFMEYGISGESLVADTIDPHFPCSSYRGAHRNACYYVQSFRLVDMGLEGKEIFDVCNDVHVQARELCTHGYGIFFLAHEALAEGAKDVARLCERLPLGDAYSCVEGVVARLAALYESDEWALPFCAQLRVEKFRARCYTHLHAVLAKIQREQSL